MNSRLRSAIQAARSANMPKDNIEAIDKSSIAADSNFEISTKDLDRKNCNSSYYINRQ